MNQINGFFGEYGWLSNFWPSTVIIQNWTFPSAEHAFQAAKSLDADDIRRVRDCPSPGYAKRMGRQITLRPDWEEIKLDAMAQILAAKFMNYELRAKLIMTGTAELIEQNTWNDTFWGVAFGRGQNHLGRLLMELRANITKEHQA